MKNVIVLISILLCLSSISLDAFGGRKFNLEFEHVPGQLIVRHSELSSKFIKSSKVNSVKETKKIGGTHYTVLNISGLVSDKGLEEVAEELMKKPEVISVEANVIYRLDEVIPNDPAFGKLYGLKNTGEVQGKRKSDIAATMAWETSTGSKSIKVGLIDSGIDYNHPDLKNNIWSNPGEIGLDENGKSKTHNGIDDDNNGYVDDWHGWDFIDSDNDPMDGHSHGTHCAGIIGAEGNNQEGVVGVNWNVSMVPLKVFSNSGYTTTEALAEAIHYSTMIGVDLTSNSWGGGAASPIIRAAIEEAQDAGIIFVAAAGNSSVDNDQEPHYPSSYEYENIISVASTDYDDKLSTFSNYGKVSVDVAAPGTDIYSTIPDGGYAYKSGTSMATPYVSGVAALIKSRYPDIHFSQLKQRVLNASTNLANLKDKVFAGRVNAMNAIENDEIAPSSPTNLSIDSVGINSLTLKWSKSGDDGLAGSASRYILAMHSEEINERNWEMSDKVIIEWNTQGGLIETQLKNLKLQSSGYLALRAIDNVGNLSSVSENLNYQLPQLTTVLSNEGSLDGFTKVESPWGVESIDGNIYISDSPDGSYTSNSNISIESDYIYNMSDSLIMQLARQYELEANYDFVYLEISVDDKEWVQVKEYNGKSLLNEETIDLSEFIKGSSKLKFRFRISSDNSIEAEGMKIDYIKLLRIN